MFISVKQASEKWKISDRRVRTLCNEGKIHGAIRVGKLWKIPQNAAKPQDGRYKESTVDKKKKPSPIQRNNLKNYPM